MPTTIPTGLLTRRGFSGGRDGRRGTGGVVPECGLGRTR